MVFLKPRYSLLGLHVCSSFASSTGSFFSNVDIVGTARIVMFWNPATVKVHLLDSSAQGLHLSVSSLISQYSFMVTFVYGFNTIVARRSLWEDLRRWCSTCPWMVLGDFNSVLSQADKYNGAAIYTYETSDFRECCSDLGLHDLNYTGCHFSWTNGNVWSKLDRVLFNPFWSSLQCSAHVHFDMPDAFSDHSPALVCLDQRVPGRRNFKFFNMWASHDQFMEIVSRNWSISIYGTTMYALCRKLKYLKGPLKELNKLHFSHISERVSRLETELDLYQIVLHHDRDNSLLLEQDRLFRLKLLRLKSTENMFFR